MNETFPEIVEEAASVGAKICFQDESGIRWSIKGQTPVAKRTEDQEDDDSCDQPRGRDVL